MPGPSVLLVGLDPHSVPDVDASVVDMAIAMGEHRLREAGFDASYCLFAPDDPTAEDQVAEALRAAPYDCVVIGNGVRAPAELLVLFERIVNLVHRHAPQAAIAFNSNPMDSADAAMRWVRPEDPPL